jgi:hypothetical protein
MLDHFTEHLRVTSPVSALIGGSRLKDLLHSFLSNNGLCDVNHAHNDSNHCSVLHRLRPFVRNRIRPDVPGRTSFSFADRGGPVLAT